MMGTERRARSRSSSTRSSQAGNASTRPLCGSLAPPSTPALQQRGQQMLLLLVAVVVGVKIDEQERREAQEAEGIGQKG